ncbi:alkaline phosphatase family protein [Fodinisporobacter ferrooxydans]|uniref:Alkaline phosphatase family protein n=1 Tax=Fodinisporobacter ferrooxydans TaxID=2901836 RepID=A0ABY4CLJ3_9BACL|nr:alkaline phosphatase family protein [Alicyclobacillaceae bacterium MYW30-H2]
MKLKKTAMGVAGSIVALSSIFAMPLSTFASGFESNYGANVANGNDAAQTTTPIKHVVVIFGENVSFDHYFGTYPNAKNPAGEPKFVAKPNTPKVNGLTPDLLKNNPNLANPQRLDRSQPITDDMDHGYTAEQAAFDGGKMDKFVQNTGKGDWPVKGQDPSIVMNYYDGNTVTGLWNYAQNFAMSDNSFGTTFGPSTPGALNLISGQTHGAIGYSANVTDPTSKKLAPDANGVIIKNALNTNGTLYSDVDPYFDKASKGNTVEMTGKNIGDLLNTKNVTWGWFEGGFRDPNRKSTNVGGAQVTDYSPHHEPFQYYKSTANPNHLPPTSAQMIGHTDQANHQYGMSDFWTAADSGNMPAVSFLKAPMYQDGHAGYSDPIDEQHFIVETINHLQQLPEWKNTAVIINYDDSDGWYDHVMANPLLNGSNDPKTDILFGIGNAGTPKLGSYLDRAGLGPRIPLLVISPYAKQNFVDHTVTNQASILRFIEDNWNLGRIGDGSYDAASNSLTNMFDFKHDPQSKKLFLDPITGEVINNSNNNDNNSNK